MYRYSLIEPDMARQTLVRVAGAMIARDLQLLPPPQIHFFREDPNGGIRSEYDLNGFCAPGSEYIAIWIGLDPASTFRTLSHELRHYWQQQRHDWRRRSDDFLERDARLYAGCWPLIPKTLGVSRVNGTDLPRAARSARGERHPVAVRRYATSRQGCRVLRPMS
jgi:hypothetical protein